MEPVKDEANQDKTQENELQKQLLRLNEQLVAITQKNQELEELQKQQQVQADLDKLRAQADIKKVLSDAADDDELDDDDDDGVERISHKQLLNIVADAVDKTSSARMKQLSQELAEKSQFATKRIDGLQGSIVSVIAALGIESARNRHPDLDDYRQEISAVMTKHPSLTIDEAYALAKTQKAAGATREETDSERPVSHATGITFPEGASRKARESADEDKTSTGTASEFRNLVRRGVKKAVANRK